MARIYRNLHSTPFPPPLHWHIKGARVMRRHVHSANFGHLCVFSTLFRFDYGVQVKFRVISLFLFRNPCTPQASPFSSSSSFFSSTIPPPIAVSHHPLDTYEIVVLITERTSSPLVDLERCGGELECRGVEWSGVERSHVPSDLFAAPLLFISENHVISEATFSIMMKDGRDEG